MTTLTTASQNLLNELVDRAADWSGTPLYNETERSQTDNGNLTDLKVKGLVETFVERENGTDLIWVDITDAGLALVGKTADDIGRY